MSKIELFQKIGKILFPAYLSKTPPSTIYSLCKSWQVNCLEEFDNYIQSGKKVLNRIGNRPIYQGRGKSLLGPNKFVFSQNCREYVKENTGLEIPINSDFPVKFYNELLDNLGL